jgi:hypothetical protein
MAFFFFFKVHVSKTCFSCNVTVRQGNNMSFNVCSGTGRQMCPSCNGTGQQQTADYSGGNYGGGGCFTRIKNLVTAIIVIGFIIYILIAIFGGG